MAKPKKLVVLGGGMGSLSALYEITSQPDWRERYDITLYQIGFRSGGKGASGRNTRYYNRIEEHGYHILFGFYHNTLAMMKACYRELGRAPNAPISDFYADTAEEERLYPDRYAIKRVNAHTLYEKFPPHTPHMRPIDFALPPNNRMGASRNRHSFVDVLVSIYDGMNAAFAAFFGQGNSQTNNPRLQPSWWNDLERIAPGIVLLMKAEMDSFLGIGGHLNAAGFLLKRLPKDHRILQQDYWDIYQFIARLIRLHIIEVWALLKDRVNTHADTYETWVRQDFFGTVFNGLVEDDLMEKGLDSINDKNFYEWFEEKAIVAEGTRITAHSIMVQAMYNFGFSFRDGDGDSWPAHGSPIPGKPNIEAGIMLRILLRWLFDYEGSPYWFFQVSCGDALFAPLYEVLMRRGVKFKFFHQVTRLSADDNRIVSIDLERQVDLKVDQYEPLILVKGVPCWPSEPLYEQIVDGNVLREAIEGGLDIEGPDAQWGVPGRSYPIPLKPLRYGEDFDEVLFGIPPGAFKYNHDQMCAELAAQSLPWQEMAQHLEVIHTESLQIRLNKNLRDLGWSQPYKLLGMYGVGDLNTFSDMPQQLRWESWPHHKVHPQPDDAQIPQPQFDPQALFYFVSGMSSSVKDPQQHIIDASIKFLNGPFIDMFPAAAGYRGSFHLDRPADIPISLRPLFDNTDGKQISGFAWHTDSFVYWSNNAAETNSAIDIWRYSLPEPLVIRIQRDDLGATRGAQWSKQGQLLLTWSNNGNAYVWQTNTVPVPKQLAPLLVLAHNGPVLGAVWSSDPDTSANRVLTWSEDSTACIWTLFKGETEAPFPQVLRHNGPVLSAAWSPGGKFILTCCKDGAARVWRVSDLDSPSPKPIFTLPHDGPVLGGGWNEWEAPTPLGRIITWSEDHTARVWQIKENQCVGVFILRHDGPVSGADWLPKQARLPEQASQILTWSADKTARLWQLPDKAESASIADAGSRDLVHGPDHDPDSAPISPHRFRWNLKPEYILYHQGSVLGAAWKPDSQEQTLLTWTDQAVSTWSSPYLAPDVLSDTGIPAAAQWSADGGQVLYALNKREFNWDLLVYDPAQVEHPPIKTQVLKANVRPSDQYVLTVVGSTKFRLSAAETGFDNLFITGDWTKATLNVGCMEAATMAGFMAARAMIGFPAHIDGEHDFELIPALKPLEPQPLDSAILRTVDAGVDFYRDLANAIALGFQGMRDEVASGSLSQRSLFNLLVSGGIKGGSQFIGQMQQAISGLQQDLGPLFPQGFDPASLDYSYLARLVAEELRKQGGRRGER